VPKRTRDYRAGLLEELKDPVAAAHYLNAAMDDSEEMLLIALRDVAEARQVSKIAQGAGLSRESVYRMLSETGNPRYSSLLGIMKALGLRLTVQAEEARSPGVVRSKQSRGFHQRSRHR